MNIITKQKSADRLTDGIERLLILSNEDFKSVIEKLLPKKGEILENIRFFYTTDPCECPSNAIQLGLENELENTKFIGRAYYGGKKFSIHDIFYELARNLPNLKEKFLKYQRITLLLKTRGLESFKKMHVDQDITKELLDKVFEILSDEYTLQKFIDFENNKKEFEINDKPTIPKDYLKCMGKFFGAKDKNGKLSSDNIISTDFYIPNLEIYKHNYLKVLEYYNLDRYTNPMYEFKKFNTLDHIADRIIRKGEEPEWTINPALRSAIYEKFPYKASPEEQAMYIYCKLCHELRYDEGYFYRDKLAIDKYDSSFDKYRLENIVPNSSVTCWEFSRLFSKMVNELEGDIEAVIISTGINEGHYLAGFYTNKVSAMVEAINVDEYGTNDLMKAKNGIRLSGIKIISDRDGLINKALDKIYSQVLKKSQLSISEYMEQLKVTPKEEIPNDIEKKIQSFIDVMQENNILGNEAVQTLNTYYKAGFFGEELKKVFIGRKDESEKEEEFKRSVLIMPSKGKTTPNTLLYEIDTENLEVTTYTVQMIIDKLNSGEVVYEDENHVLSNIEEGR